jgi:DNA-binding HxlR family transcriptional regulator
MILRWLAGQPAGFAFRSSLPLAIDDDLRDLERQGLVSRMPSAAAGKEDGYVITGEGARASQGD